MALVLEGSLPKMGADGDGGGGPEGGGGGEGLAELTVRASRGGEPLGALPCVKGSVSPDFSHGPVPAVEAAPTFEDPQAAGGCSLNSAICMLISLTLSTSFINCSCMSLGLGPKLLS